MLILTTTARVSGYNSQAIMFKCTQSNPQISVSAQTANSCTAILTRKEIEKEQV